ncbi:MAG: ATP phosphoribosyltransferase regulatory subunit [Spirochaetaceae bacterium]|nr:ATP phosphoribosyltransferase regulatory subunit [Spirochaetaceae bacterium]MCF7947014.1 ATP phosphoribosyltransferase regulatory subunit [Spirochaetia bacterium]MCF7950221.1 ATP phosphoribosyltransferase regulatory subunit [Spirochaetaceae bacterium]
MTDSRKRYLQVPQGTEGVHLEEAYRHRRITQELYQLFTQWGYLPVETPVFDFYDIYEPLLRSSARDVYRLIDREGDLLMLRSDITLFLAKQMGLWLREEDLPTRVCYADTILRHQSAEDISKNEFFQTGAELIGKAGSEADLEVLLLLESIFMEIGVTTSIHLGSHQFLTLALKELNETELKEAVQAIRNREQQKLHSLIEAHTSPRRADVITALFSFIGNREEFSREILRYDAILQNEEMESLQYLTELVEQMEELGYARDVRIDLSEVGTQPYYTGIVFQVYQAGLDDAVASGGRYDKLLSRFGFDCPSVGFSMMLRKIENQVAERFGLPEDIVKVEGKTFAEAFRAAQQIREKGGIAIQ